MSAPSTTGPAGDGPGLYLHMPFCTAKCGYCDFNSYAGHEHAIPSYPKTLLQDAALWRDVLRGRPFETVFFGGGTPSLTPLAEMAELMSGLRAIFEIRDDGEVSLEANPGSLDLAYLEGLRGMGFNRLSLGVQSFDDEELVSLDRIHTASDAVRAFEAARAAGFENVNLDLIYGLPEQTEAGWERNLERALALGPEHLSLYALTVEEGTPLARDIARGRSRAPDPDVQASMYEWTQERLAAAGYEHYEISNWARPGRRCRHNLLYWRHREYLGLGAGAHSYLDGVRFGMALLPSRYAELVEESSSAGARERVSMRHIVTAETPAPDVALADALILGLRLLEGVDADGFAERYGASPFDLYGDVLREFEALGVVAREGARLRLTKRGLLLSNELFMRLLPETAEAEGGARGAVPATS